MAQLLALLMLVAGIYYLLKGPSRRNRIFGAIGTLWGAAVLLRTCMMRYAAGWRSLVRARLLP